MTGGSEEREVKLAVPAGFVLPSLDELGDVTTHDHGENHLRAVYWETDDLVLARAGVGVRHRNGVWTFKGRSRLEGEAVVREEVELEGPAGSIPAALRRRLATWVDVGALRPIAQLRTVRRQIDVSCATLSAELVHDRVSVRDGAREVAFFEEVEVEFAAESLPLADRIVRLLIDHGAAVDPTAKLVRALRALGHEPPVLTL